tara:strand:+ start:171 stop:506 length:336 start_codon:yes stop_codon:yes gene_type:complete
MNAGEFRHRTKLTIKAEAQQSDYGDFATDTTTDYYRYAKVKWLPGSEKVEANVIALQKNAEFTFRKDSITELIDRIDVIAYGSDKFFISEALFKGHANEQYVVIKGHTAAD